MNTKDLQTRNIVMEILGDIDKILEMKYEFLSQ